MKIILSIILIFSLWIQSQAQLPEAYSQRIDSLFQKFNSKTPGYSVAVLKDGEVIYKKSFGMADVAVGKPITSETSFDMASISKQFTAMCILLLEERGKLSVEDDIRKYLPEIPQYRDTIKIKHLLLHTSGIKDGLFTFAGNISAKEITQESLLKILAAQKSLNFKPGEEMIYSNAGYDLLGIIVERTAGMNLRYFAKENIFAPLGMRNTQFSETYEEVTNKDKAYGYTLVKDKYRMVPTVKQHYRIMGCQGLYSTVEDLILWQRNYEHNIIGSQGQTIVEKMWTKGQLNKGGYNTSGYGLFINWYYGKVTIGHSGGAEGYVTDIQTLPKEKLTVICLSSMGNGTPSYFVNCIFNIFYPPPANFNRVDFSSVPSTTTKYLMNIAKQKEGIYYDDLHKRLKIISVKNDTLLSYDYPGYWPHKNLPIDSTTFKFIYNKWVSYEFKESSKGQFIQENKSDRIYYKMEAPQSTSQKNYIGKYESSELGSYLTVIEKKGKLIAILGKEINTILEPLFRDGFSVPEYADTLALVIFENDADKKIKGVSISIERARNIYFEKVK